VKPPAGANSTTIQRANPTTDFTATTPLECFSKWNKMFLYKFDKTSKNVKIVKKIIVAGGGIGWSYPIAEFVLGREIESRQCIGLQVPRYYV
jgi:hypothetical protein